ncbi:hypothetical protein [Celeribacter sp.]|uniref:hypothetical protein n=1 Tax=Celeribacter sp. TaxID=1890673 RepID=UPI003A8D889E
MPAPRRILHGIGLALCLMGAPLAASAQSAPAPLELTQSQLLDLAARELAAGRAQVALDLAEGLLTTRPNVYDAHLIRTDALRQLGRTDEVLPSARAAWREATSDAERTRIARLAAHEAYRNGRNFQSKFWLRRAMNTAESPLAKQNIIRNFNQVRQADPWRTQLSFNVAPSSNVNNGAQGSRYAVDGITLPFDLSVSPTSQALSGYRASLSGSASYTWDGDAGTDYSLGIKHSSTRIVLSSEAKASAPSAKGSDYDTDTVELAFGGSTTLNSDHGLTWSLGAGRIYSAHAPYADTVSLTLTDHHKLKSGAAFRHGLTARYERPTEATRAPARSLQYSVEHAKRARDIGVFRNAAYVERVFSNDPSKARDSLGLSTSLELMEPVLGTKASFALGAEMSHYEVYPFLVATDRTDKSLYLSARFTLIEHSFYGFAPEVRIDFGKTWSNVSRFDTRTSSIGLGIKSAF